MVSNKKIKNFLHLLGPLILVYILFKLDYPVLYGKIKLLKWQFLVLAEIFMILEILVRSLRWRTILSSLGIAISKTSAFFLFWLGAFVSIITPGKIGELIKAYFLKKKGFSVFRSFFSIVLDRIIDIFTLLFFGFLIFLFFSKGIGIYIAFFAIILLIIVLFVFLLMDQRSFFNKIFGWLIQKIFPVDFNDYSRFTFAKFWQGIRSLKKNELLNFFIYLIFGWFVYFSARYLIALSLGLDLSFINVSIISVSASIVALLPISIAGLGTREAVVIYFFGIFGIDKEIALLFSLLILTADLIITSFGLIPYLKESALINKIKQEKINIHA